MTYSEREREFTFAKNVKVLRAKLPAHWYRVYAIPLLPVLKLDILLSCQFCSDSVTLPKINHGVEAKK